MCKSEYADRLRSFYDENGLLVCEFRCRHSDVCKAAAAAAEYSLNQGAEAHVGSRYGRELRLVVVSLDTGGKGQSMDQRRCTIENLHPNSRKNAHMKGTTRLLEAIYGTEKGNLYELYAMTNAAKCSRAGPGRAKVGPELYRNCSDFVTPELTALDPQLIVTQGNEAWRALGAKDGLSEAHNSDLEDWIARQTTGEVVRGWLRSLAREYLKTACVVGTEVPTLKTIHPSVREGQWHRFAGTALEPVVAMAKHLAKRS